MKNTLALLLILATVLNSGCARSQAEEAGATAFALLSFQEIENPAVPGSAEPNLHATASGDVFLSWVEPGVEYEVEKTDRGHNAGVDAEPAQRRGAGRRCVDPR